MRTRELKFVSKVRYSLSDTDCNDCCITIWYITDRNKGTSYISLTLLYWYVGTETIWENLTAGHMRVTVFTIEWKWRLWGNERVNKLIYMIQAIRLARKGHYRIYHIIIITLCHTYWGFIRSLTPRHINNGKQVVYLIFIRLCKKQQSKRLVFMIMYAIFFFTAQHN